MDISKIAHSAAHGNDHAAVRVLEKTPEPIDSRQAKDLSEVRISSKEKPMQLLKSSIQDKLNDLIAASLGRVKEPTGNRVAYDAEQTDSPKALADQVIGQSMSFFELFKKQHQGEDEAEVARKYMETVGKGVNHAFAEAREILGGLGVLKGDVASNVDQTRELIQQGMESFIAQFQSS